MNPFDDTSDTDDDDDDLLLPGWGYMNAMNYVGEVNARKHVVTACRTYKQFTGISKIDDMGNGILVVEIPSSNNLRMSDITKRFKELRSDRNLFPDYNSDDYNEDELSTISIGKYGCFVSIHACRAQVNKRYCLVVKSYPVQCCSVFRREVKDTLKQSLEAANKLGAARSFAESRPDIKFVNDPRYTSLVEFSTRHRIGIARYVLRKIGVVIPLKYHNDKNKAIGDFVGKIQRTSSSRNQSLDIGESIDEFVERYKITGGTKITDGNETGVINTLARFFRPTSSVSNGKGIQPCFDLSSVLQEEWDELYIDLINGYVNLQNTEYCSDFPIVFLKIDIGLPSEKPSILIFNHVYDKLALHNGAPLFINPRDGFFTYNNKKGDVTQLSMSIRQVGAPTGVRFKHDPTFSPSDPNHRNIDKDDIYWDANIDIRYLIADEYYTTTDVDIKDIQRKFEIGSGLFWKTVALTASPPIFSEMDFLSFCDFYTEDIIELPMCFWGEFSDYYTNVYEEWMDRLKVEKFVSGKKLFPEYKPQSFDKGSSYIHMLPYGIPQYKDMINSVSANERSTILTIYRGHMTRLIDVFYFFAANQFTENKNPKDRWSVLYNEKSMESVGYKSDFEKQHIKKEDKANKSKQPQPSLSSSNISSSLGVLGTNTDDEEDEEDLSSKRKQGNTSSIQTKEQIPSLQQIINKKTTITETKKEDHSMPSKEVVRAENPNAARSQANGSYTKKDKSEEESDESDSKTSTRLFDSGESSLGEDAKRAIQERKKKGKGKKDMPRNQSDDSLIDLVVPPGDDNKGLIPLLTGTIE